MKITADRKALASALKTATAPAATSHLAILGGLHLHAVTGRVAVTGSNLDLTIATDVEADVDKPGTVVLPGRLLAALVDKAASDTVSITVEDEIAATVESGRMVASIRTLKLEDWPEVATAQGDRFELTATDVDRLRNLLHATETDKTTTRPALLGINFAGNYAQATDSYRLAKAQLGCDGMPDVVVPADVVARVVKGSRKGLTITFDKRSATFDSADDNTTWTSRLIAAEFPRTEALIRLKSPHDLRVNRAALAEALGRVRLLADGDETHPVDLVREGDTLRLVASSVDVGDICDEVSCTGDWEQPIRFHDRYLAELLANHDGDEVTFEIDDPLKPVITRTSDWRLLLLIMPVRIPVVSK